MALSVFAMCAGLVFAHARPSVAAGHLTGIDVSHWQGTIRWDEVDGAGVAFAIAKATEGRTVVDDQYANNRANADAYAIPFTAYHFARPDLTDNDARAEANHFVTNADLRGRHLLPVLDLEVSGGLSRKQLIQWARTWLQRVESQLGVKPMIYTTPSFWRDRMGNIQWFAANGYRLWIAHWDVDTPRVPAGNWGDNGWTLWQTSQCGQVAGIDGCVDLDRYRGTNIDRLRIRSLR